MNKSIQILLVEDNLQYVRLFEHLIEVDQSISITIKHAPNLKAAVDLIQKESFDLIVLDLFLPDSRGTQSITTIKQTNASLPIILLTALDDPRVKEEAIEMGVKEYLLKDQIVSQFVPTLQKILIPSQK